MLNPQTQLCHVARPVMLLRPEGPVKKELHRMEEAYMIGPDDLQRALPGLVFWELIAKGQEEGQVGKLAPLLTPYRRGNVPGNAA